MRRTILLMAMIAILAIPWNACAESGCEPSSIIQTSARDDVVCLPLPAFGLEVKIGSCFIDTGLKAVVVDTARARLYLVGQFGETVKVTEEVREALNRMVPKEHRINLKKFTPDFPGLTRRIMPSSIEEYLPSIPTVGHSNFNR